MNTKICTICKKELPATSEYFAGRADKKIFTFQSSCRKCHKEYRKKHYQANKQKYIHKAKTYTKKVIDWFTEYKKDLSCEQCGEQRWWVLDFHHLNPHEKEANVAHLINRGSRKKLIEEVNKCKVLCSNCHRDLHFKKRQAGYA